MLSEAQGPHMRPASCGGSHLRSDSLSSLLHTLTSTPGTADGVQERLVNAEGVDLDIFDCWLGMVSQGRWIQTGKCSGSGFGLHGVCIPAGRAEAEAEAAAAAVARLSRLKTTSSRDGRA